MRSPLVAVLLAVACRPQTAPLSPDQPVAPAPTPQTPEPTPAIATTPPTHVDDAQVATTSATRCDRDIAPLERVAGDLVVHAPPDVAKDPGFRGRLRTHTEGPLSRGAARRWVGPHVPGFVPLAVDTTELTLLERDGDIDVAVYRDPYGASSCNLDAATNCRYVVTAFRDCAPLYTHELSAFMSRKDHLEVQDLHVVGGILYFNEACQSYSKEAKGKCSSLVAVDTATGKLLWRTKPLVSNNRFVVLDRYIVTGYGFTAERDALFVVRRTDGKVMQRVPLKHAQEGLVVEGTTLTAHLYEGTATFELRGFDGDAPTLVSVGARAESKKGG